MAQERPNTPTAEAVRELLRRTPTQSGLQFAYERNEFLINPARYSAYTGGVGVTSRTLQHIDREIPTAITALRQTAGKVIFIGNGLSPAPIETSRFSRALVYAVDLFEYRALARDLDTLFTAFTESRTPLPYMLDRYHTAARALMNAGDEGSVHFVRYFFGSGQIPAALLDADVVINCFGPPYTTMKEQLRLLAPGGALLTNSGKYYEAPAGYTKTPLTSTERIEYSARFGRTA